MQNSKINYLEIDKFIMPGEFEEHEATLILWPYRSDIWKNGALQSELEFARVANTISKFEVVIVGVIPTLYDRAKYMLDNNIIIIKLEYIDAWVRDSGPTFVRNIKNGSLKAIDWRFNAWGGDSKGLYIDYEEDDAVASVIAKELNFESEFVVDFVLEGGSIHVDGEGTLITTKECLLDSSRNNLPIEIIERTLKEYLGVEKIIWLEYGLAYDETSGHVDNICCFAKPGELLLAYTNNVNHPSYDRVQIAYNQLLNETDAKGRSLKLHLIDLPDPIKMTVEEMREKEDVFTTQSTNCYDLLPASYINFYFCNNGIILPLFGSELDDKIIKKFKKLFPNRIIVGINSREILLGGGNVHCITQQIPKRKM